MGRIDDALQRSGVTSPSQSSVPSGGDVFVSPWSVPSVPAPKIRPAEGSPVPSSDLFDKPGSVLPRDLSTNRPELMAASDAADPVLSAQFRRMAATLHNAQDQGDLRVVMVTSAAPSEGKTLTALNLAQILSQSFKRRVLLIDADLRRPSIHRAWGITNEKGLTDGLGFEAEEKLALCQVSETLTVLPAGRPDEDPTGGLTSARMRSILEDARAHFDWVILDSPPIASVDDATLLGAMVDAVVFVVRATRTRAAVVKQAVESSVSET